MKKIWIFWITSLLLAVSCVIVNRLFFRVSEMLRLEFAASAENMRIQMLTIGSSIQYRYYILKMNTIVDYGFLVAYSLLTFFSLKLFLDVFQISPKKWWVYVLSFGTGLLDAVENYFLLKTAIVQQEAYSPVFFWAVRIKWAFAIVPILLIPMILLYGLILLPLPWSRSNDLRRNSFSSIK